MYISHYVCKYAYYELYTGLSNKILQSMFLVGWEFPRFMGLHTGPKYYGSCSKDAQKNDPQFIETGHPQKRCPISRNSHKDCVLPPPMNSL